MPIIQVPCPVVLIFHVVRRLLTHAPYHSQNTQTRQPTSQPITNSTYRTSSHTPTSAPTHPPTYTIHRHTHRFVTIHPSRVIHSYESEGVPFVPSVPISLVYTLPTTLSRPSFAVSRSNQSVSTLPQPCLASLSHSTIFESIYQMDPREYGRSTGQSLFF